MEGRKRKKRHDTPSSTPSPRRGEPSNDSIGGEGNNLRAYREKRNFSRTREPEGGTARPPLPGPLFVVQKHAARRLHYDLRLEAGGALKSWAVPKGPSYDPEEKRLAVQVEDHPLEYADFEGLIAEHQYGAGTVMVWDRGTWTLSGDWETSLKKGHLKFRLEGLKLKGSWSLVRIKSRSRDEEDFGTDSKENWLLIKSADEEAGRLRAHDITAEEPLSAKTGRSMEEIAAQKSAYWERKKEEGTGAGKQVSSVLSSEIGVQAPLPESFLPQMAALVSRLPEGDRWISEIKFDGYRILARLDKGRVRLTTRRGQNWTEHFADIAREITRLPVENAVLDGEIVALDPGGTTNFQKLQNFLKSGKQISLAYYVFDIPYYQNHDLTGVPLLERKNLLRELVRTYRERIPSVRYSEHVEGSGERVFRAACAYGIEGMIAKGADSPYVQNRSRAWLKRKCINRQEFVVGGFAEPKAGSRTFRSLMLGYYNEKNELVYCGNVGTGFNAESLRTVYDRLKKLEQDRSPFASPIEDPMNRNPHWVSPKTVVEVKFANWTEGGHLRQPSFVGIREDKNPLEVTREKESPLPEETKAESRTILDNPARPPENDVTPPLSLRFIRGRTTEGLPAIPITLSNPDKVLYPDQGLTKKQLAEYYVQIAPWMLPELMNRPLVLFRCPEGIQKECFFQKRLNNTAPEWIKTVRIEEKSETGLYPVVQDIKGLLSLVQLGVLEFHMWGCRADNPEYPDRMVFDLDPSPEVSKERLKEAALYIRGWLLENNMKPLLKLTGGKGIHIVVPLKPALNWEEVKRVSREIALQMSRRKPDWFTATISKKRRTGKILLDYFRNNRGATSIAPYSTRARPGAPVAFPISETELTEEALSDPVTVRNAVDRVRKMNQDPWKKNGYIDYE